MTQDLVGLKIYVRGIVQGVGFRPFIYSLAKKNHLTGWVRNTSGGVEIEVNGLPDATQEFLRAIREEPPALARIDKIDYETIHPNGFDCFTIIESQALEGEYIPISPDVTICAECQTELFSAQNRRYRYPFINCTNCGPRFSIIQDIPYDRPKTTMSGFPLCPSCQAEYEDPLDRRFHAQPNACPECGPHVWFEINENTVAEHEDAIKIARKWLSQGKIIAIKGLGGYHLACDAYNSEAVSLLRKRKKRSDKPFALMAFDLDAIQKNCYVTQVEASTLVSRQRPIVLLKRKPESKVSPEVAPGQDTLGIMTAYTPLHLLLTEPENGFPEMLVMTSGNISEEPIAYHDQDAHNRLSPLADAFLLHNRDIHIRVDDSVVRLYDRKPYFYRRARGYAPESLILHQSIPPILAAGALLKNTFCLARGNDAFLSHHIGDLENYETLKSYEEGIAHYQRLFRVSPELLACDLHPDYLSTRYAQKRSQAGNLPLVYIQHHHAHLAACLVDNGWDDEMPVIGLTFDGSGYGTDGAIWGGEVLYGNYHGYQRMAHLVYTPMPGGELAIHHPARMALAHLWNAGLEWEADLPPVTDTTTGNLNILRSQLANRINTPPTSSMGRLFDAASSLVGIRHQATYEGQAAIELENVVDCHTSDYYSIKIENGLIDPAPMWEALIGDLRKGSSIPILAARFHNSIVHMSFMICSEIRSTTGCEVVALSGGVWQNMVLLKSTIDLLQKNRFKVLYHQRVPTNDGGISLGQAMIAAAVHT